MYFRDCPEEERAVQQNHKKIKKKNRDRKKKKQNKQKERTSRHPVVQEEEVWAIYRRHCFFPPSPLASRKPLQGEAHKQNPPDSSKSFKQVLQSSFKPQTNSHDRKLTEVDDMIQSHEERMTAIEEKLEIAVRASRQLNLIIYNRCVKQTMN